MVCLCSDALPMSYGRFVAGYSGPQWINFLTWFSLKRREQAPNTSIHSELKIAQLFVLLVRPKLVIKFIERKTLFSNPQDQIRNSPHRLLNQLRELGFFLYLFSEYYKCIDTVMHEKLYVNFQELKRIYLINIKKIYCSRHSRPLQH